MQFLKVVGEHENWSLTRLGGGLERLGLTTYTSSPVSLLSFPSPDDRSSPDSLHLFPSR